MLMEYHVIRKPNPPPFLLKTYMIVDDPATDTIISWNVDGTAFVVWQPAEFARDLLPIFFKHCNFSSFVRQLNTYGFRKVATTKWEFCNDMFQRGNKELLREIRRRKAWSNRRQNQQQPPNTPIQSVTKAAGRDHNEDQRSSSTSTSSGYTALVQENKRLKQENGVLTSELLVMKNKCKQLLDLVSMYSTSSLKKETEEDKDDGNQRPKLFGVRLDVPIKDIENERKETTAVQMYKNARLSHSQS